MGGIETSLSTAARSIVRSMNDVLHASFLETAGVAQLLNVTPARVRQLADAGRLQCSRTAAGTRLFLLADVEAFLALRANRNAAAQQYARARTERKSTREQRAQR